MWTKLLGKGVASSNMVHRESDYTAIEIEKFSGGALEHHVRVSDGTGIAYSEHVGRNLPRAKVMGERVSHTENAHLDYLGYVADILAWMVSMFFFLKGAVPGIAHLWLR